MSERHVVVTGAAGFVGSHLVDRFVRDGWDVTGIDNLCTGSRENLAVASASERFALLEADASEPWRAAVEARGRARPTLVLHLASPASPVDYARLPLETLAVNARGTEWAVRAAHAWGARVLFASTSETYGEPLEHPQRESYFGNVNALGPRACYDEAKRYGEAYLWTFARLHGTDVRIARIFNTYGPRMALGDGRVVPNFIVQALRGEPLTIYGDGTQTRSFCYVDDLVEGLVRLATRDEAAGAVVNLGNPAETTIAEFAHTVARLIGTSAGLTFEPLGVDDPTRRRPDVSRAADLLGWRAVVRLEDGLSRAIADVRRRLARATPASVGAEGPEACYTVAL